MPDANKPINDNFPVDIVHVLSSERTTVPDWLATYKPGDPFPREEFFNSRTIYYPGSEMDGHAMSCFCPSHAAHCFVFCDNQKTKEEVLQELQFPKQIGYSNGYQLLGSGDLEVSDMTPDGFEEHCEIPWFDPHLEPSKPPRPWVDVYDAIEHMGDQTEWDRLHALHPGPHPIRPAAGPFVLWAVLERKIIYGDDHGPDRICILHVGDDAFRTFDALFCQQSGLLPYSVVLVDHGRGGNWSIFGSEEGPLWQMTHQTGKDLPEWLLVTDGGDTKPWPGYGKVAEGERRGQIRLLYRIEQNR